MISPDLRESARAALLVAIHNRDIAEKTLGPEFSYETRKLVKKAAKRAKAAEPYVKWLLLDIVNRRKHCGIGWPERSDPSGPPRSIPRDSSE